MQTNQLTDDALRSLARSLGEVEADEPVVVRLFLDLDPAEFATAPARETQITSLLSQLDALIGDGTSPTSTRRAAGRRHATSVRSSGRSSGTSRRPPSCCSANTSGARSPT